MLNELSSVDQNIIEMMALLMFISLTIIVFEVLKNAIANFLHTIFLALEPKIKWKK
jgi:hypothetical protein